jgi:hypothetical protein
MIGEKSPEALPREVPNYHEREAAHLQLYPSRLEAAETIRTDPPYVVAIGYYRSYP